MIRYWVVIVFLLLCKVSHAQFIKEVEFVGGTSFSKLTFNNVITDDNNKYKHDVVLGGGVKYFEHKFWNLSTNLQVIKKGGHQTIEEVTDTSATKIVNPAISYVSFNTLLCIKAPLSNDFIGIFSIGPRFDILEYFCSSFDAYEHSGSLRHHNFGYIVSAGFSYEFKRVIAGAELIKYVNTDKIAEWTLHSGFIPGSIGDETFCLVLKIDYKLSY